VDQRAKTVESLKESIRQLNELSLWWD